MHAIEKAKLVRHHAKRLRQLGADQTLVDEMISRLNQADVCSAAATEQTSKAQPNVIRRTYQVKACRGALGIRARQARKQVYSVVNIGPFGPFSVKNRIVILDGGEIVKFYCENCTVILTQNPVRMRNVRFVNCAFELPVSETPSEFLRQVVRFLLATADTSDTTIKSL